MGLRTWLLGLALCLSIGLRSDQLGFTGKAHGRVLKRKVPSYVSPRWRPRSSTAPELHRIGTPNVPSQAIFRGLDFDQHDPQTSCNRQTESLQGVMPTRIDQSEIELPHFEITRLLISGTSHNRVNLMFYSDGYTSAERGKFLQDASRLAQDISGNQTFNTVKPLLNLWAAFTPSKESGIGIGGTPKDTPFGLYRDGTELRGVYYAKPQLARAACDAMGDRCDYPILLGNDPLYGGLGGEITVVTASLANGPLVLRHELGHSIIDVGEEYDGGFAYFGVNSASNLSQPLSWSHWLSSHPSPNERPRIERSVMPMQVYPWTLINTTTPWSVEFVSSGLYSRYLLLFSLSGLPDQSDLKVEIDGEDVRWRPREAIGVDRWHYVIRRDGTLTEGNHEVKFTLKNKAREGLAQLCSVEILELGDETDFVSKAGYYGVFPTFSEKNKTTYRPTNEDCLMRDVTSPNLCKVCLEGLWLSLLRRVDLIDDIREACVMEPLTSNPKDQHWKKSLEFSLVPLAHLRSDPVPVTESYTIHWMKDGRILETFTNKTRMEVCNEDAIGTYIIDVEFRTDEVRKDTNGLLTAGGEYTITSKCPG